MRTLLSLIRALITLKPLNILFPQMLHIHMPLQIRTLLTLKRTNLALEPLKPLPQIHPRTPLIQMVRNHVTLQVRILLGFVRTALALVPLNLPFPQMLPIHVPN